MTQAAARLALLDWLPTYRKEWLRFDIVAGLTTAAVVIPKAMAYATIAGLPVQVGLYTAFVPLIVYAVLGTSRPISASTTTTIAILTGAALDAAVPNGDPAALLQTTALLTLMVGATLILASVLRLGFVANFISEPVLIGFKAGIGVVIIVDQIPKVLGIHFTKGTFLHNVWAIVSGLSNVSVATLVVGALTILMLAVIEKFRPRWPAPLVVIAIAIAAVGLLGLQDRGIELVGAIPAGLPAFNVPGIALANQLWPAALGIALMSFTETAAVGRAFARSDEPSPRPNAELFATGMANAAGAMFGSMPSGGGMSQTAVNRMTGARTQIAGLTTAVMTLLTMLLLAPLLGLMPHAVLGGIVIFYSIGLIRPDDFRDILAIRRTEFIWAGVAFVGVMLIGTLQGILVAIIVSLVALARQSTNRPVYVLARKPGTNVFRPRSPEHAQDESFPGLLLLRLEGRVFFLNSERFGEQIRRLITEAGAKVVVLDFSGVFDLEYSAVKALIEGEKRQREAGLTVWLAGLSPDVDATIQHSRLGKLLGRERIVSNLESA
ncbi:MAG TPA: SulP family inorganic anion transporter, partial [Rhodanobacteraceae bacterium]|nr:SulP family inorganic anion transporter [Rhodanobacteraceae bacterium]